MPLATSPGARPAGRPARIERIALFSLDSLGSRPAFADLFAALPGRIGLVVSSVRVGRTGTGLWRELRRHLARSGPHFVAYLAAQHLLAGPAGALARRAGWRSLSLRELARRAGAAYLETGAPNRADVVERVADYAPDLIITAGFDRILRAPLIAVPRHGVINIHGSLLPDHRGVFPVFWSLRHAAPALGVSVHVIDSEEVDAGPLLDQRAVAPRPGETLMALDARVFRLGAALALRAIASIEAGQAVPAPQPRGAGSYHSFPARADVAAIRAGGRRLLSLRDVVHLARGDGERPRP
jgi:methionyl-tRNA formyltransferase